MNARLDLPVSIALLILLAGSVAFVWAGMAGEK